MKRFCVSLLTVLNEPSLYAFTHRNFRPYNEGSIREATKPKGRVVEKTERQTFHLRHFSPTERGAIPFKPLTPLTRVSFDLRCNKFSSRLRQRQSNEDIEC
ncbi:hypothetical protein NPIL_39161 [Nephila pilipes]|uniref:Uncharacterized protein n=1 Tax=Nephila pilipes TaxID=299642 RepID=A0A8X6TDW6_NEPPI|nr:hypothetical protein NPIL_39161 [Nephila pilipes]